VQFQFHRHVPGDGAAVRAGGVRGVHQPLGGVVVGAGQVNLQQDAQVVVAGRLGVQADVRAPAACRP
jgi:hypothetical protein